MKCLRGIVVAGLLGMTAVRGFATDSPAADGTPIAIKDLIAQLGDEDFNARQKAMKSLQKLLSDQVLALAMVKDSEIQAGLVPLLSYEDGLIRWVRDVMAMPEAQRNAQLAFASQSENLPVLADVFSPNPVMRLSAAKVLAKMDSVGADALLGQLIGDDERSVEVGAMEAVWDRKPTDFVVDALWRRAVGAGITETPYIVPSANPVMFRGQPLMPVYTYTGRNRSTDADVATDVLIHMKAPQVTEKLVSVLKQGAEGVRGSGNGKGEVTAGMNMALFQYSGNTPSMRFTYRLLKEFKPKEAIPYLYELATCRQIQDYNFIDNNARFSSTNRTAAIGSFLELTGQPSKNVIIRDFAMQRASNVWVSTGTKDENDVLETMKQWWGKHASEYGVTAPSAPTEPTTSPATLPVK